MAERSSGAVLVYFDSFAAAWAMAGHGPFVWSAYGLTFITLAYLIFTPLRRSRMTMLSIRAELKRGAPNGRHTSSQSVANGAGAQREDVHAP